MTPLLLLNLVVTAFMTGVIWFVQIVHYPLFARIGANEFARYERSHTRLTTAVVAPAMLVEAATAVGLLLLHPDGVAAWILWTGVALVAALWLSTALVQVPQHGRLERGFDAAAHRRLVRTNWLRTALWSARTILMAWAVAAAMSARPLA